MIYGDPQMAILDALCAQYGRPIDHWDDDGAGNMTPVFVPLLTPTEQAAYDDLAVMATLGLQTLTLQQYRDRKADVAGLKAYMALGSPTATQTRDAFRALVRVVGAMLKVGLS